MKRTGTEKTKRTAMNVRLTLSQWKQLRAMIDAINNGRATMGIVRQIGDEVQFVPMMPTEPGNSGSA